MGKVYTFVVVLRRDSPQLQWGLRLVGGSDIDTPLIITRVNPGTPAQKELIRGDIITKIDDYDARDLRHEDAQNLFRNAGNQIRLVVQRDASLRAPSSMSNGTSRPGSSMILSPLPAPYIPVAQTPSFYSGSPQPSSSYRQTLATPVQSLPYTTFPPENPNGRSPGPSSWSPAPCSSSIGRRSPALFSPLGRDDNNESECESINNQPYRTTPLVLPGAKVKKDNVTNESYLRHHPNPSMRAAPHHDHEVLMRQKYAHKQFNSPIGLYSEANIIDSIKRDTNTVPYKKTVLYDPSKSETFKALQEESYGDHVQEVIVPPQPKVYQAPVAQIKTAPVKNQGCPPQKPQPQQQKKTYVAALQDENIQQSNSFKRLMYHVLGETDY